MNEINLFNQLKEGYKTSTHNHNSFKQTIDSINWDSISTEDGESSYMIGCFSLSTGSTNPFDKACEPSVIFSDGSMVTL